MTYRRPIYILVTLLLLFLLGMNVLLGVFLGAKGVPSSGPPIVMLVLLPLITIFTAIRQYRSSPEYKKPVLFTFDEESVYIKADKSGRSELSVLHKVVKTGSWLLIYQNPRMANMIPLRIVSGEQLLQLKEILVEAGVKNNL